MKIIEEKTRGTYEGIVIPKGTIVSYLTFNAATGMMPNDSGTIPVFIDQSTGSSVDLPIDDNFYGYQESITALLVPANGGEASTHVYSTLDDDIANGWLTSSSDNLVLSANIPAGMMLYNVYQDIRGAYLNHDVENSVYTCMRYGKVNIPCVNTSLYTEDGGFGTDADVSALTASPYASLRKTWQFLRFAGSSGEGLSGVNLTSDLYGKLKVQSTSIIASKTVQTVGKLLSLDFRFPKYNADATQTYPGTLLQGVNTKGLPSELYMFVHDTMVANGHAAPATDDILAAVRAGKFGYARVLIDC
jgi:hypothetical protein